jgi:hypothetical protein
VIAGLGGADTIDGKGLAVSARQRGRSDSM